MIRKTKTITEIVQSHDPKKVTEQLNKLLEDKAAFEPIITSEDYHPQVGHFAKVRWVESIAIPEDARDQAELEGKKYYCFQCPFYSMPKDKRVKYSECEQGQYSWYDKTACVELYEMIEKGLVNIDT